MEGGFGTEKQHYSLDKIKAKTELNEILWIFFGVHTANAVRTKYMTKICNRGQKVFLRGQDRSNACLQY
jgi:hypothetical protein